MIQINWKSFHDHDLTLEIDDGSNVTTPMTPSANPFVTSGDDSQDMFTPIRYQTGSIGIVGTLSELEHLIGSYPLQRPVTLYVSQNGSTPEVVWKGFVQSATYSQSWHSEKQDISIPVVSKIGVLEYVKIPQATVNRYVTFAALIKEAADSVGGFDGYVFPNLIIPQTTLAYNILVRNFARRDESVTDYNVYITDSYDVVLSEICKLFGLTCIEHKNLLCFIAPDYVGDYTLYSNSNMVEIDAGDTPTNPTTLAAATYKPNVERADNRLSYLPGKRTVKVTGKVNPFDLEPLTVEGDEMPLGATMTDSWGYEANHPDTYFTKCFLTDRYAFMDVIGVGEIDSQGNLITPSVNKNVRFENFGRKKVYNDEPYYGCSFVCEREYLGDTRIAVTGSYDQDTGWQFKTLMRLNRDMIPFTASELNHPLVTYISRARLNYSYLWCFTDNQTVTGAKYLSINGSVNKCTGPTLQHNWEGATGYFYAIVSYGLDVVYSGLLRFFEGKFSGGTISNQYGSFAFERRGFVIQLDNNTITERNAQLTVSIFAFSGGIDPDDYYSIEDFNVSIENRWTELDAPMNEREENSESEDTNHGWVEDLNVDIEMTTAPDLTSRKISAQFGEGIVLANDVMEENPHVLYNNKSSELALKERFINHYSDSKKLLEAKVGMIPNNFGPLEPWQTHSPDNVGNWCVLSQTINWRDELVEGMFFER